jgi:hypothetical protein
MSVEPPGVLKRRALSLSLLFPLPLSSSVPHVRTQWDGDICKPQRAIISTQPCWLPTSDFQAAEGWESISAVATEFCSHNLE